MADTTDQIRAIQTRAKALLQTAKMWQRRLDAIEREITALEQQGTTDGRPYWRTRGKRRYLELIHPQRDGKRPRDTYVGIDPAKIAEALAQVKRAEKVQALRHERAAWARHIDEVFHAVNTLTFTARW